MIISSPEMSKQNKRRFTKLVQYMSVRNHSFARSMSCDANLIKC
jgi:hypothetical protein